MTQETYSLEEAARLAIALGATRFFYNGMGGYFFLADEVRDSSLLYYKYYRSVINYKKHNNLVSIDERNHAIHEDDVLHLIQELLTQQETSST
jgi:hypothetical protein